MILTPSHIIEYLYCPRFTYFEYVLCIPQNEEKFVKVKKGREVHEMQTSRNRAYLRKKIGVVKKHINQYLTNQLLRGEVDEVLALDSGTMAPLDYKFAQYNEKVYNTYKTQLYCYACLIEDNFNKQVTKGFLVYTRSQFKVVEIGIQPKDKEWVKQVSQKILAIIQTNYFPKGTPYKKRCLNCTYKNICIQ